MGARRATAGSRGGGRAGEALASEATKKSKAAKRKQQKRKAQQQKKAAEASVMAAAAAVCDQEEGGATETQGQQEQEQEGEERKDAGEEKEGEGEGATQQAAAILTAGMAALGVGRQEEEGEDECSVCFNVIESDDAHNPAGPPLLCGHRYHAFCLHFWVERCASKCIEPTCPYCRSPLQKFKG